MWRNAWARYALCAIVAVAAGALITSGASGALTCTDTWIGGHSVSTDDGGNDWNTPANWSNGVPKTGMNNLNVCIESGTAVLSTGTGLPTAFSSIDIGSAGSAALDVAIGEVLNSASTTIAKTGTLVLNGTYNGANAGNAALGGGPVDNAGTIVMEGTGYSATLFGTILNTGTISVPYGTVAFCQGGNGGAGSLDNQGTISVAGPSSMYPTSPSIVQAIGCAITDDNGGTIVNDGTFSVYGTGSSYTQGNGTESGNAIGLGQAASLSYTGTGASSVNVSSSIPMAGNLAAGQQLYLNIGTTVTEASSFTSAGQITLDGTYHGGGGGPAQIAVSSGSFTNNGLLTAISGAALSATVINNGTVTVEPNSLLELMAGSFTNGSSGSFVPQISSSQVGDLQIDTGTTFTGGGTLAPQLEGGFTPTIGEEFDVVAIHGGSYSGQFATNAGNWHGDYASPSEIGAIYGSGANVTSTPAAGTTTTPTPTPTPTSTKKTTPASPRVTALAGGAAVIDAKLRCESTQACSSYTLVASVTEHLLGTKLTELTAAKKKTKTKTKVVTVASVRGSLKAGKTATDKLTLNKTGLALLKRFGRLKVSVVITAGGKVIKRETLTVTRASARKVTKKK